MMDLPNQEKGFIPLIVVLVIGLVGLAALSNIPVTQKNTDHSQVAGVLIAQGGDDSGGGSNSGSGDSGSSDNSGSNSGSTSGSPGGPGNPPPPPHGQPFFPVPSGLPFINQSGGRDGRGSDQPRGPREASSSNQVQQQGHQGPQAHPEDNPEGSQSGLLRNLKFHLHTHEGSAEAELQIEGNQTQFQVNGITAHANFPISFDPATGQLVVNTPQGSHPIGVLPDLVARVATESGIQDKIDNIDLLEASQSGSLNQNVFRVDGQRIGRLFGFIPVQTPVQTNVSADTGAIIDTTEPFWLRLLSPFIK